MTQPREIEGVLDQWFADGPRQLSDRALLEALSEIDNTRQLGAHVVPWRFSEMPTPVRVLLVAALMAVSAGAAFILAGGTNPDVPPPTALPSVPVVASPVVGVPELIGTATSGDYVADRPAVFGLPAGEFSLHIPEPATYLFAGRPGDAAGPGTPEFILGSINSLSETETDLGATDRCPNVGRYQHALSEDTRTFTIALVSDECVDRATLLAGEWRRTWIDRQVLPNHIYRVPIRGATVDVTVPSSFLSPVGDMTIFAGPETPTWAGKFGTGDLAFLLFTAPDDGGAAFDRCHENLGLGPAPATIEEYLEWSRGSRGLEVANEIRTTVAGLPAVQVDLRGGAACQTAVADLIPPTMLLRDQHLREWAIDLGGRMFIATIADDVEPWEPLSPAALATGQAFIDSMAIVPDP